VALFGYLVGAFSAAVVVGRLVYRADIRKLGSGNAGAANMLRTLGWKPAVLVLAVDVAKGFVPTLLAPTLQLVELTSFAESLPLVAGAAAVIGHCFPLFAGFRGGKGVATAAGMGLALYPGTVFICVAVFTAIAVATRFVSLASVGASIALPVALLVGRFGFGHQTSGETLVATTLLAGFIVFTHRANVSRMWQGTEPTLGR